VSDAWPKHQIQTRINCAIDDENYGRTHFGDISKNIYCPLKNTKIVIKIFAIQGFDLLPRDQG